MSHSVYDSTLQRCIKFLIINIKSIDKISENVNIFVRCERHMETWINLIFVNTVL